MSLIKEKKKLRNSLISTAFSLVILGISLSVSIVLAWFSSNKNVTANGMQIQVTNNIDLEFEDEVIAIRHCLIGDVVTNTYIKNSDGRLILTNSISTNPDYEEPDNDSFLFDEMLPGEYVDIKICYTAIKEVESDYSLSLADFDFSNGVFEINSVTYNVLGAFKFKPISINYYDEDGELIEEDSLDYDETYMWLQTYTAGTDSINPNEIPVFQDEWKVNFKRAEFTFRIYEDFSQYYRLINAIGESVPNQLSEKVLRIGQIRLSKEE